MKQLRCMILLFRSILGMRHYILVKVRILLNLSGNALSESGKFDEAREIFDIVI